MAQPEMIANVVTGLSAIVGVAAFLLALYEAKRRFEAERIQNWQKVIVYSIIEQSFPIAVSFADIRRAYLDEAQAYSEFNIPKKEISDSALKRIILNLIADNAIVRTPERTYTLIVGNPSLNAFYTRIDRVNRIGDGIMRLMNTDSGRYTVEQIRMKLAEQHIDIQPGEFEGVIASMSLQRLIDIKANGKVYSTGSQTEQQPIS